EHRGDELARVLLDGLPRAEQGQRHQERRQDDEEDRDAVDAELEVRAEPRDPLDVEHELERVTRLVEVAQREQRDEERDRRARDTETAMQRRLALRRAHDEDRADDGQRENQRQYERAGHYCTSSRIARVTCTVLRVIGSSIHSVT